MTNNTLKTRIAIMTDSTRDPWQTDRPWQIIRSDVSLAHVFMPLSSFNIVPASTGNGYTIVHTYQPPQPDCFADVVLRPTGSSQPTFQQVAQCPTLPAYDDTSASAYADVALKAAAFMEQDYEVQRLEGVIKVPCHAHGAALPAEVLADHPPFWIRTLIHVYQFSNVVNGDGPLLLLRAPLSPLCPTNTDGTAVGIAR
jgi:hypothetical protein